MSRTTRRVRAFAPDPDAPGQPCDMPGCVEAGEYRAPKSRDHLRDFHWFCLAHVRAYNAGWDFYKGMSPGEIEAQLRADTAWQRPSWPLGSLGGHAAEMKLDEELRAFDLGAHAARRAAEQAPADLRDALGVLGLAWPVTRTEARNRYKELAKKHHPDANGGDKAAEERLKIINLAYANLRAKLPIERRPEPAAQASA